MNQPIKFLLKSQKFLSQRIRKRYYKTLGTSVINSSLSPLSLETFSCNDFLISSYAAEPLSATLYLQQVKVAAATKLSSKQSTAANQPFDSQSFVFSSYA